MQLPDSHSEAIGSRAFDFVDPVLLIGKNWEQFDSLSSCLKAAGFVSHLAESVPVAWRHVVQQVPFAVIIDVTGIDPNWGWNLCRDLAEVNKYLIVLLTPNYTRQVHVKAVSHGADQCFAIGEDYADVLVRYLCRHRARLQHLGEPALGEGSVESTVQVDLASRRIYRKGRGIKLTKGEFAVFELLQRVPDQTVCTQDICQTLWSAKETASAIALLKQYVARLRQKIEPDPHRPIHLETVRGIGYCFHLSARLPAVELVKEGGEP